MSTDPIQSFRTSARGAEIESHGAQRMPGAGSDMQEFDEGTDRPDLIDEDAYPWHQLRSRETALFIQDTY